MISVLLIDDDPVLLDLTSRKLEREPDFAIQICNSPAGAIELARSQQFDAIIFDYTMPGMNGCLLMAHLRSCGCDAQFILYSGRDLDDEMRDSLEKCKAVYVQRRGNPLEEFPELTQIIRTAYATGKQASR